MRIQTAQIKLFRIDQSLRRERAEFYTLRPKFHQQYCKTTKRQLQLTCSVDHQTANLDGSKSHLILSNGKCL